MRRRQVAALVGGLAAGWPLALRAEPRALPVIGYLGAASPESWGGRLAAFRRGLGEAGYVEGQNVTVEYRWADGKTERLGALAAELVDRKVAVIVTPGSAPAALAAKAATSTIPIVFETGADPVAVGLVPNLNRPGGNISGVTAMSFELGPKRLELIHEVIPQAKIIGLLVNPGSPYAERLMSEIDAAARRRGVQLKPVQAAGDGDLETVFATLANLHAEALLTSPDPFLNSRSDQLAALALRHAMPTVFHVRTFAVAGGLMSYGGDIADTHRLAGLYTGRILKGEKPADLPVQQSTKVELIINLRTARTLGLALPPALLARADEVIE